VQLRFDREVAAIKDQKIIIRLPAPARTVAGGVVVDPAPRHRRSDPAAIRRLEALASSEPSTAVLAALSGQKPRTPEELVAMTGLLNAEVAGALEGLEAERRVLPVGGRFLTRERWEALRSRAVDALRRYHAANPLKLGMSAEELRTRVGWRFGDWAAMLRSLADSGVLRQSGALVALPTHAGGTGGRRTEVDAVLTALRRDPFAPPSGADLQRETGADGALLAALVNEGEIVRISPDVYLDRSVYADLVRRVLALIAGEGPVTVAQVRDHFGTSRKYALAFMEHLDDERITRRVGDTRVAGSRAPACA
jgi:selenocysteine-specific elongation factor